MLVGREPQPAPNLFVGVVIDCSGSMSGDRLEKAKSFGALILEAVKKHPGIDAHAIGFTDQTIFDVGGPGSTAIGNLEADGGNNDSAGLLHMAQIARQSGKKRKLLVMISDGYPTECSFESLCNLVTHLETRHRMVCVQVAVEPLDPGRVAFPHYTDLSEHDLTMAINLFGRMIQQLIQRRFRLESA